MTTVAVVPGFCEGKRSAYAFNKALQKAGFAVMGDIAAADVIVAHSGGCYLVPKNAEAKLVVLIGVPFWPGKPLFSRMLHKISTDFALHWRERNMCVWLWKTLWNTWYFWKIPTNLRMLRAQKANDIFVPKSAKIIVVRNKDDAYSAQQIQTMSIMQNAAFHELPGQHDDLWENPPPYIEIIYATPLSMKRS